MFLFFFSTHRLCHVMTKGCDRHWHVSAMFHSMPVSHCLNGDYVSQRQAVGEVSEPCHTTWFEFGWLSCQDQYMLCVIVFSVMAECRHWQRTKPCIIFLVRHCYCVWFNRAYVFLARHWIGYKLFDLTGCSPANIFGSDMPYNIFMAWRGMTCLIEEKMYQI